jgi:hypothetical protein
MNKLAILLPPVALAALVGCGSDPVTPAPKASAPTAALAPVAARPGFGRVESIAAAPASSAAAGGATMRRLSLKMEDGTLQQVDTVAGSIAIGDRVELTGDGKIRH